MIEAASSSNRSIRPILLAFFLLVCILSASTAFAQGTTAFTYQGQLKLDGVLVSGTYDFKCIVYDGPDPFGATELGTDIVFSEDVESGLFEIQLDFGSEIFDGRALWMETQVREAGTMNYFILSPLQQLTPVPYATFAVNSSRLGGEPASSYLTEEVDPSLPPAVQSGCRICLGWADNDDPDPDVERCHSLGLTSRNDNNYIAFDGNVDDNDRLWLWVECP